MDSENLILLLNMEILETEEIINNCDNETIISALNNQIYGFNRAIQIINNIRSKNR